MTASQFKPAWWLRNPHMQTIWPALCRRPVNVPLVRERLELPDGDFIDLDWMEGKQKSHLVLILHGLEGSIESHYAKGMLQRVAHQGWSGLFMHFRGCSGEPNRLRRFYHSGDTGDISFVVDTLFKRYPDLNLAVIGYSLGGNVLLKWLGETGRDNPIKAGIAVSVPFELHKAARRIQSGFSKFYQWYFIRCLRERMSTKFKTKNNDPEDISVLYKLNTMIAFDDAITAPFHGFSGVDEYYTTASSRQYLSSIQVPTLIVHAKDDPFMTEDMIPSTDELSPKVTLELSDSGGHVGFVTGKYPWRPHYWLETRVPYFLKEHL